jgi:acetyltransferase
MLEQLRSGPLLAGYRGRAAVDLDKLVEVLIRFSYLVASAPEIREFDINPLLASSQHIIALDARAILGDRTTLASGRPFDHLAIRPYPEAFIRRATLNNGVNVLLRPIRPEDEPLWREFMANCSFDTRHARFGYSFKQVTHEMASRF